MEKKLSAEEWINVLENEADERYKKTSENLEHYAFRCGAEWSMQFWRGEAVSDAVEFAEWVLKEAILPRDTYWFDAGKHLTTKELYQHFKTTNNE